jgi:cellulose synthase/poly-beta-1,6-N-acetylglucosamine synthase-like glycosyltransferase
MGTPVSVAHPPTVSVIVPARNEEACLGACLASLVAQAGIAFEIIVVDDGSTDRTRAIAESFPGVGVIEPGPLLAGWSGKNNAVTAGRGRPAVSGFCLPTPTRCIVRDRWRGP